MDEVVVRVKRLSEQGDGTAPRRAHEGDAGLDLYAAERVAIGPGERRSVGTALAVAIPEGHAGLVVPRSGLAERHGLSIVNAPGVIDSGYRGEVRVLLLNTDRAVPFHVDEGMRIAQLVVVPVAPARIEVVSSLGESERGESGFGSTGR